MLVLSMDGPNTYWSVFEKLNAHKEKNELPQILEIGSCGLHAINGAFQTGVKETWWELDWVLEAIWKLFKNSLARRDLYITLNRKDKRDGLKDESIASRAINVWKFVVVSIINHYESLRKPKRRKNNKSYDLLVKHMTDDLMMVKF